MAVCLAGRVFAVYTCNRGWEFIRRININKGNDIIFEDQFQIFIFLNIYVYVLDLAS